MGKIQKRSDSASLFEQNYGSYFLRFYACVNNVIVMENVFCRMHSMSWSSVVYLIALFLSQQFCLLSLATALRT
jgi:hypothetical protein